MLKPIIKGTIEFKNVSFCYTDTGIQALKNISFTVKENQTIGILGNTGSGKSSIGVLLCRLYDQTEGEILIDGISIKDFDVQFLRSQIGYVPQDVFLFSDTLSENISFGLDFSDTEKIHKAAEQAGFLDTVLAFENKFDTEIGERGITLSGGQKQRLALARALIREPKILILDDCLSSVDTKTENIILDNLNTILKHRTSIIISHRISSLKNTDHIIVLDNGQLVEQGKHTDLLSKSGYYKSLYEKQK